MARICVLKRFFCCDLQMGTYCVAVFCMTLAAVNIWTFAQAVNSIENQRVPDKEVTLVQSKFTDGVIKVSYATIGFFVTDIVVNVILLCGAFQLKRGILWAWITWRVLFFAYLIGVAAFFYAVWEKVPPVGIILLVDLVVAIACFIVVYSLIQEINENERLKNEVALNSPGLLTNRSSLSSRELYL